MKKQFLAYVFALTLCVSASAQSNSPDGNFTASGNATNATPSLTLNTMVSGTATPRLSILAAPGTTAGFVGIGTPAPSDLLHVNGNIRANQFNSVSGILNTIGTANLSFRINNTARMTILGATSGSRLAGFVGLNTTTPDDWFHVNGNIRANQFNSVSGVLNTTSGTTNMSFNINGTTRMLLQATTGALGIGITPVAGELLHVNGSTRATQFNTTNGTINTIGATTNLSLNTNGTPRVTVLANNGFMGVNKIIPIYQLDVTGTINASNILMNGSPLTLPIASITGNIPVSKLNAGTGANATTFWRGDGTWATVGATSIGGWSLSTGGTLTGANTVTSSSTNPLVFDITNSQESGYYSFIRGTISGTSQVPLLAFRNDAARLITDGMTDVYLGPNNGNTAAPASGNIGIGSYNLNQINSSGGTWTGTPFFSYFRGDRNIAIGFQNGMSLTGGAANAASTNILIGNNVLKTATQQSYNIFIGYQAAMNMNIPLSGSNGQSNTGLGQYTMQNVTGGTANSNTAIGPSVLRNATTINTSNTFVGSAAGLNATVVGSHNTAIGSAVLGNAVEGLDKCTAVGTSSMRWGGGTDNTAVGRASGWTLRGSGNTAIGYQSAHVANNSYSTSAGTPYTGSNSTFIGYRAGYQATDAAVSNVMVIGNDFQPNLAPNNVYIGANNDMVLFAGTSERMRISNTGNVGIGTSLLNNPNGYKLAVNGKIGAKDVQVEVASTTWPDYVFDNNYNLPSLTEVAQYIHQNKHLIDVPSAEQVEKEGHSLGEMDKILLKKIEELTLYVIQQQKEIEELRKKVEGKK